MSRNGSQQTFPVLSLPFVLVAMALLSRPGFFWDSQTCLGGQQKDLLIGKVPVLPASLSRTLPLERPVGVFLRIVLYLSSANLALHP